MARLRGFEVVSSYLDMDVVLPKRKTKFSAGYDIHCAEKVLLSPGTTTLVPTGLKAYMLDDEVLKIYIRSSVGVKKGLRLANGAGIIDADYYNNVDNEGHIFVAIWNPWENKKITLDKGERIAQGIFSKYLVTDDDDADGIRVGGCGSTGK